MAVATPVFYYSVISTITRKIFRILRRRRVDGVMDTAGQGWLLVNVYVVDNGVGVAFLNVMLEIGVRFQMSRTPTPDSRTTTPDSRIPTPDSKTPLNI
ncbi:hypothetical protein OUZ56_017199 [Daphnia magna]|uniref:Uncharacterized protein n=1 Tax=Daphnia magna TaxID=35525 RepID=A0ABR0ASE4_9CRUS|nr:hypothetical protein OUZ56_017199 [Daphnia magna]